MPVPTKDQIADLLESIAQMLELKGENVFKIRAYTNAARAIETYSGDLATAAAENRLGDIAGVGKAIADKLTELIVTGQLSYYENLKAEFPPGIFEMFDLQGIGPKKIKALWEKLNVTTIAELEKACKDGRVAALAGFGKKTSDNILAAIQSRAKHAGRFRLGEIAKDAERMLEELKELPDVLQACVAGSYRRRKEVVGDLDFIVATNSPAEVSEFFVKHEMVESVIANGATKSSVRFKSGIQADLRVIKNPEYPFALNYFTGSKEHNIIMRQRALARGWTLNEYRLGPVEGSTTEPPRPFTRSAISIARSGWITWSQSCARTAVNSPPPRSIPCPISSRRKTCAAPSTITPWPAMAAARWPRWPRPRKSSACNISASPITPRLPSRPTASSPSGSSRRSRRFAR